MIYKIQIKRLLAIPIGVFLSICTNATNPYDVSFGNEYTIECTQLTEKEINSLLKQDTTQLDVIYTEIVNRFDNFTILEKAKFYQKYKSLRRKSTIGLSPQDKRMMDSCIRLTCKNLNSFTTLQTLFSEADNYCRVLFNEEIEIKNRVDISPDNKTIPYYLIVNPQKFAGNSEYDMSDLKPSGELLITPGGVIKAMSFSDGWKKVVSYNRKSVAVDWVQVNINYYVWPYLGDDKFPKTYVFIKASDNP